MAFEIFRSIIGLLVLVGIAYLLSSHRNKIPWKTVIYSIIAQVIFAFGILKFNYFWISLLIISLLYLLNRLRTMTYKVSTLIPVATAVLSALVLIGVLPMNLFKNILESLSNGFVQIILLSHKGTEFLFGSLANTDNTSWGYVFAIQVLPNIVFFSALSSLLYYLGILQLFVKFFSFLLSKFLYISGAESLSTAANIFLGQTEAPLFIKPYLKDMTRSEILCIMVGGMANTAGSVMAAYVSMLSNGNPELMNYYALHLMSATLMSAPATIAISKVLLPQTENISKEAAINKEKLGSNVLDAISIGTIDGLKLAANVGAMLVAFIALMALVNGTMEAVGGWIHFRGYNLNQWITLKSSGVFQALNLQLILAYLFAPIAYLIGVNWNEVLLAGQLLGEKTIINEFFAYSTLSNYLKIGVSFTPKTLLIITYALSGFANFASIGIQIGGISTMAPNQRQTLTELGVKSLIGGTICCLMTANIAGLMMNF
ncbi:MAG: hypothetical protein MUE53_04560 [Chitinophagales bacterium]|jgi:CNT family concentrative nucleoside transporter|nr:hypothetical protein [Chitinophagales bacterium]